MPNSTAVIPPTLPVNLQCVALAPTDWTDTTVKRLHSLSLSDVLQRASDSLAQQPVGGVGFKACFFPINPVTIKFHPVYLTLTYFQLLGPFEMISNTIILTEITRTHSRASKVREVESARSGLKISCGFRLNTSF